MKTMDSEYPIDLSVAGSPQVSSIERLQDFQINNSGEGESLPDTSSRTSDSTDSPCSEHDTVSTTSPEVTAVQLVKKKVSKPSVLPTFLPPCRICNAKASGFHYGEIFSMFFLLKMS